MTGTDRVLGIIMCPVFNDELIHNIINDSDVDTVVVLTNDYSKDLCIKLESSNIEHRTIPESEFVPERFDPTGLGFTILVQTNNLGLHGDPPSLKSKIERQIEHLQPCIDALGVYYCQCGNADFDPTQWCREKGLKPASVYRGDDGRVCYDCACVAFGSTERYMQVRSKYGEVFYLTPAITYHLEEFVSSGAMGFTLDSMSDELKEQYGIHSNLDIIRWMLREGNIERSLKIDTKLVDPVAFDRAFMDLSREMGLKPIIIGQDLITVKAVDSIYAECKRNIGNLKR